MYKVPAPLPYFLVLARLYAVVDSCGARLHKSQHSHSSLPMDPLDNPDYSLGPVYYNSSTTTDDVQRAYRTVMTMPPPGAAPTYPTISILSPQVGLETPFLSPTGHYDHTNRVPAAPSTDSPSDGSETSFYDLTTSTRNSTPPTPRTSHVYDLRRSLSRKS